MSWLYKHSVGVVILKWVILNLSEPVKGPSFGVCSNVRLKMWKHISIVEKIIGKRYISDRTSLISVFVVLCNSCICCVEHSEFKYIDKCYSITCDICLNISNQKFRWCKHSLLYWFVIYLSSLVSCLRAYRDA